MSRQLLNTLYVMTQGAYASLDGDTVLVKANGLKLLQAPLLHLGGIVLFGGSSISPPLMERCAEDGRDVVFLDFAGRFKARVVGPVSGNVLLRKAQYEHSVAAEKALAIARNIVAGKIKNARGVLLRSARDSVNMESSLKIKQQSEIMADLLKALPECGTLDEVRGVEGVAASSYFNVFGDMITGEKSDFAFHLRTRRPPRDRVNALLSFLYSMLTNDCVGAAEGVGLDPQFGFLHAIRPGRPALALDLMEEFRACLSDRLALSLINRRQIQPEHFEERPGGSVMLNDAGRKIVITAYQKRKQEETIHPFLKEKIPMGLVPHLQARLLARCLRGDTPHYLPYIAR